MLVFTQSVSTTIGACPALAPREPVVLAIDAAGAITVDPPATFVDGVASSGHSGSVDVTLVDDWAGLAPSATYHVGVAASGIFEAYGNATLGDCVALLELDAARCPSGSTACGEVVDGWNVACASGVVSSDDLTRYRFCAPGDPTPACEVGGVGGASPIATCPGPCADTAVHWFATMDAYQAFDPLTLCAP